MSKKLDQVGLEPTTFGFPCLRSCQLSYWSDNGPEASETYITITRIEFIQCYTVYARVQFMLEYLTCQMLTGTLSDIAYQLVVQIHSPAPVTPLLSRTFYFTFRHIAFITRPPINYMNFWNGL